VESLDAEVDFNKVWESVSKYSNSAKGSQGYYELKLKTCFDEGCPQLSDQRTRAKFQCLQNQSEIN
jgi:hypothetical protein